MGRFAELNPEQMQAVQEELARTVRRPTSSEKAGFLSHEQILSRSQEARQAATQDQADRGLAPEVATQVERESQDLLRQDKREGFGRNATVVVEGQDPDATQALEGAALDRLHHEIAGLESPAPYNPQ